jgi:hypothetical protein
MRPNQEVYRRVEKIEIIKLLDTCMKSSFHNNMILQSYHMPRTMCPTILVVYRYELYGVKV